MAGFALRHTFRGTNRQHIDAQSHRPYPYHSLRSGSRATNWREQRRNARRGEGPSVGQGGQTGMPTRKVTPGTPFGSAAAVTGMHKDETTGRSGKETLDRGRSHGRACKNREGSQQQCISISLARPGRAESSALPLSSIASITTNHPTPSIPEVLALPCGWIDTSPD